MGRRACATMQKTVWVWTCTSRLLAMCRAALGLQPLDHCRRYDLWLVSSDPLVLPAGGGGQQPGPRSGSWLALCRSLWHGPDRDGKFQVEMLTAAPPAARWDGGPQTAPCVRGLLA